MNKAKLSGCDRDKALRRGVAKFDKVSTLRAFNRLSLLPLHEDDHIHSYPKRLALPSAPSPLLTKIPIASLSPKSLMRRCCIHATIATPPKRFFNTLALVVEDDGGNACRLLLHNTVTSTLTDEQIRRMYPQGGEVVIKGPMVDNFPEFDGVMLVLANPECLEVVRYNPSVTCRDGGELKELGNAEFKAGCFEAAVELYTKCVSFACKDVEKVVAYSNRAEANLTLGRYEEALADAEAALRINPRHAKSCSRKARVLAAFHRYVDACGWFKKAVEFSVGAAQRGSARVAYEKCRVLMLQSVDGSHDLRGYVRSGFDQRGYAEGFAEYVGPVEVMRSELRRRGLFVTRDVKVGELLMVCNGVGMGAAGERPPQNDRDCIARLVQACRELPRSRSQVYALANGHASVSQRDHELDVAKIQDAWHRNREYTCKDSGGLFPLGAIVNHSCRPNVSFTRVGCRTLFVFAAKEMKGGEEMVRSYGDAMEPGTCEEIGWYCERCSLMAKSSSLQKLVKRYREVLEKAGYFRRGMMIGGTEQQQRKSIEETLIDVAEDLETFLERGKGMTDEQKDWIRVAFFNAYTMAIFKSSAGLPSTLSLLAALHAHAPGAQGVLNVISTLLSYVEVGDREAANALAVEECKVVYGSKLVEDCPEVVCNILSYHHSHDLLG